MWSIRGLIRIWKKPEPDTDKAPSKLDLAWQMLQDVRKQVSCRLWVVMDRWYFSKPFLRKCESANFDWITKAKRNTKLFRRLIESGTGRERFVPIQPKDLIHDVYPQLKMQTGTTVASVACQDIYMQMPVEKVNRKGQVVTKLKYTPIAAVVGWRIKEDSSTKQPEMTNPDEPQEEPAADYKGAYLLVSNRHDAPQEVLSAWLRRWNIEILFRTAKQELGMLNCHSPNENHIHAHLTLLFTAETLIRYLLWQQRKTAGKEDCTHGQVIRNLICIRCHTRRANRRNKQDSITIDLDTVAVDFARLIRRFWPPNLELGWVCPFSTNQLLGTTA